MSLSVMDASTLPRVNDKALEFEVNIKDAQFNLEGLYFLRLSVQSLHTKDYSKIKIKESGVPYFENRYEGETDTVAQKESTAMVKFKEKQFVFRLPKGFCMNDKNHDVHLLVEAFTRPKIGAKCRKVGEEKCTIYPRPNAPRIKVNVEPGDDFYNYTDIMSLLWTVSTDSVQMHCGRIRCTYALREVLTVKPKSPPKTSPVKKTVPKQKSQELREKDDKNRTNRLEPPPTNRTITPTDSWGGDNVSINVPATPPLPPQLEGRKISKMKYTPINPPDVPDSVYTKSKRELDEIRQDAEEISIYSDDYNPAFESRNIEIETSDTENEPVTKSTCESKFTTTETGDDKYFIHDKMEGISTRLVLVEEKINRLNIGKELSIQSSEIQSSEMQVLRSEIQEIKTLLIGHSYNTGSGEAHVANHQNVKSQPEKSKPLHERIREHFQMLVSMLEIKPVLDYLYQAGNITMEDFQRLRQLAKSDMSEANRELLFIISRRQNLDTEFLEDILTKSKQDGILAKMFPHNKK